MAVYFILTQKLKDDSIVNENVDDKVINPIITLCQDQYIEPVIGSDLMDEIKSEIEAGNVSANNSNLLNNYIQPALKWFIVAEGTISLSYKFTNKAVLRAENETSELPQMGDLMKLSDTFKNKGQFYAERLRKFLCKNRDTYTKYRDGNNDIDDVKPTDSAYDCGIVL